MRAVPLADARVIQTVNTCFIPLFIDYRKPNQTPEFTRLSLDIDRQIIDATGEPEQIQLALFRADGKFLYSWPHTDKWQVEPVLSKLQSVVESEGTRPGEPVFPEGTPASRKNAPDDLVLEVTSHFLITEEEARVLDPLIRAESDRVHTWEYPPDSLILHRVQAPSQDWYVMPRSEWTALVEPPGGGSESSWEVKGEPALRVLRPLVPPNELHLLTDDRLDVYTMTAERVRRSGDQVTIRLTGTVHRNHPYWAVGDDDVAEAAYCGYLEYDAGEKKILSFRLATRDGIYRGQKSHPSLKIPWGVAVLGHP